MQPPALLFYGNEDDRAYLPRLKPYIGTERCFVHTKPITTMYEIESYCKERGINRVLSTNLTLLRKLADREKVSLDNFAGSLFKRNGIEYVFLNPLEQTVTVPYGEFLLERFVSKLTKPEKWLKEPEFKWRVIKSPADVEIAKDFLSHSVLIGEDIETFREPLSIRCIGYTGLQLSPAGELETYSFVLPLDDEWKLHAMRELNSIPVPKVFQNGKYDVNYLMAYNSPPSHWFWDTANMMHSWYCELPKDLAFLQAFFVRNAIYWKDLAETRDLEQYYLYNAKDTWATVLAAWTWIHEAPDWAKKNYLKEFPVNYPCVLSELTGIERDFVRLEQAREDIDRAVTRKLESLNLILGTKDFNVNSPKHMRALMDCLGCRDIPSADDKAMAKAAYRHPLNARIIELIRGVPKSDDPELAGIRAMRKIKSTYLRTDADAKSNGEGGAKEYKGKVLYSLNPHGTDSGRLASREHHFWCGLQVQNMPAGALVKQTLRAPDGFYFGESDLEQAETRDTAYITGDTGLIAAVNSGKDFHSLNTAAFFGVAYEDVYDDATGKQLNKPLRNLAKRVNHGANYNMGPDVMVDTMGEKAVYEAGRLLNLPCNWAARDITSYLLEQFGKAYPVVRFDYQLWVKATIARTRMLIGATGWTRYCFGDPSKSKPWLNTYISHSPQSLNAMVLNEAFLKVFYNIAMNPKYAPYFRLYGQIHDSIPFAYHKDHLYLPDMVKERMEIPVTCTDISGKTRTFTVPAALKIGKHDKEGVLQRAIYWSETE